MLFAVDHNEALTQRDFSKRILETVIKACQNDLNFSNHENNGFVEKILSVAEQ